MYERFTERARQVVVLAQEEARRGRVSHVGTEHILLGILGEEEGLAAKVLTHLGVSLAIARGGVDQRLRGRLREDEELKGQLPLTPKTKKVLELALREALSLGHNYIGTEHIALGLIHEENVALEILRDDFSLTSEQIRTEIIHMLSGPKAPILNRTPDAQARKLRKAQAELDSRMKPELVREVVESAITLGRMYPGVPVNSIVDAALSFHTV